MNSQSELRLKHSVLPSHLVYHARGKHSFGGPPFHRGAHPANSKLPVHRILTLDASDPLFPLENYPHKSLPLYYPLAFSSGGGEIQYSVVSDEELSIVYLSDSLSDETPYCRVPEFPEKRGRLVAYTYSEARAWALSEIFPSYEKNWRDRWIYRNLDLSCIVGKDLRSCQGEYYDRCRNPKCRWHDQQVRIPLFAIVSCSPKHAPAELWWEYTQHVELCFGICRVCGTFIAGNRCL